VTVTLEHESIERLIQTVKADVDPTDSPPAYAFTQTTDRPEDWTDGAWEADATQSGNTWTAKAITPLVGGDGATVPLAVGKWFPWLKLLVGDETIVTKGTAITIKG
jgi:hypothetical protein